MSRRSVRYVIALGTLHLACAFALASCDDESARPASPAVPVTEGMTDGEEPSTPPGTDAAPAAPTESPGTPDEEIEVREEVTIVIVDP